MIILDSPFMIELQIAQNLKITVSIEPLLL